MFIYVDVDQNRVGFVIESIGFWYFFISIKTRVEFGVFFDLVLVRSLRWISIDSVVWLSVLSDYCCGH